MSQAPPPPQNPLDEAGSRFDLKSVCWGYRDIFAKAIEGLYYEDWLGSKRPEVTESFFDLLSCADQSCYDHVLKEFLCALNPRTRWLMDLPAVFSDVTEMGRRFANAKLYYGIGYFRILGGGGFGDSPERVRHLMTHLHRLWEVDHELAFAFLKGYERLADRLGPEEVNTYVNEGLEVFHRNRKSGLGFLEGTLKSSETIVQSLTRECRLQDIQPRLEALLHALTGTEVEVSHLGQLDSDDLIERGTRMVCLYQWLYLPVRMRHFDEAQRNRNIYLLMAVVASGMLAEDSFPKLHGHERYHTCEDLVGGRCLDLNLFQIVEHARVLLHMRERWPGVRRLLSFGLAEEFREAPPVSDTDRLFRDVVTDGPPADAAVAALRRVAAESINFFDTAQRLEGSWRGAVVEAYPAVASVPLRTFAFLPDFLFPVTASQPPSDALVADLRQAAEHKQRERDGESADDEDQRQSTLEPEGGDEQSEDEEGEGGGVVAAYVYDEWSQPENDYYRDYCFVHEKASDALPERPPLPELGEEVNQIRRVFERFKPDILRKEKFLEDGEIINPDLLLEYLVESRKEPEPRVRFYERPHIQQRDLAVLILLDASGSTGETVGQQKVIDIEKHAALLLGEGLASLGDRFSICGFSSNGREHCTYYVYKDFAEKWEEPARSRVLGARPSNATRIGAALRHAGYRLAEIEARQRLIILVTDGKPMDSAYDPQTRYAQHDVRMSCEENARQNIFTFGISTEENSLADMEIMFPQRRFAILDDIRVLPRILPKLYIRMTV